MGQLLFVASADAGSTLAPQNVYLSGINGNDANDGLTPATAVATFSRVWELLPLNVYQPFVVHIGAHGGAGYTYELPPEDRVFAEGAFIVLYGDGAGQAGEDGFIEIASGVAGASTNGLQLELAAATTLDNYRHWIIEYTSGAAAGYRRSVRDNSTTVCFYTAAMENTSGALTPAPGDSYRILSNAAQLNVTTINTIGTVYQGQLAPQGVPLHALFVTVNMDQSAAYFVPQEGTTCFGFDLINAALMPSSVVNSFWGVDDSYTGLTVRAIYAAIGRTYVPQEWHGVGLSFSDQKTFNTSMFSMLLSVGGVASETIGSFHGFVTGQTLELADNVTLRGGSAAAVRPFIGRVVLSINSTTLGFAVVQAPFKIKSTSSSGCVLVFAEGLLYSHSTYNNGNLVLDCEQTVAMSAFFAGIITNRGYLYFAHRMSVTYASTTGSVFDNGLGPNSVLWYAPAPAAGFSGLSCNLYTGSFNSLGRIRDVGGTYANGITLTDSARLVFSGGDLVCSGYALHSEDNTHCTVNATCTWEGAIANGGTVEVLGGNLVQTTGSFTITNSNVAATADALRVRAGAEAQLLGGASTPLNAAGGYGVNARFGGRVFFAGQPQGTVTGAGELIVDGTIGAQLFAALAASESAVAFQTGGIGAFNGSIIARST